MKLRVPDQVAVQNLRARDEACPPQRKEITYVRVYVILSIIISSSSSSTTTTTTATTSDNSKETLSVYQCMMRRRAHRIR